MVVKVAYLTGTGKGSKIEGPPRGLGGGGAGGPNPLRVDLKIAPSVYEGGFRRGGGELQ